MTDKPSGGAYVGPSALAVAGLRGVAAAQVSNMILARALAGASPPFVIAFFRWSVVAAALAPFSIAIKEIRGGKLNLAA